MYYYFLTFKSKIKKIRFQGQLNMEVRLRSYALQEYEKMEIFSLDPSFIKNI